MITITFPDQNTRDFDVNISGFEIAKSISNSLAKEAVAIKVDGNLADLHTKIEQDCTLQIIKKTDQDWLEILRHDCAHLLAQALKELYPNIKLAIGPVIADGFYYDCDFAEQISVDDFPKIEQKMRELAKQNFRIEREFWPREKLIEHYREEGEIYKVELIEGIADEQLSVYKQGNFVDLCRGPHAPNTSFLKHFKLTKIAGSYWRGDAKNKMLQRIYGTLWNNDADLKHYLDRIEEAKKRDHRVLGKNLNLFHLQEEALGQVFWHEKGMVIYREVEKFILANLAKNGYQEIKTPLLLDKKLWEKSGHCGKYGANMFFLQDDDGRELALKPMNCPAHVQIFNQRQISYRDLPLRLSEFGTCHRNEASGALHGLMRVRSFVQDDAHIFCTEEQIEQETRDFCQMLHEVYRVFGFEQVKVKLATRPEMRSGDDATWDRAEASLANALQKMQLDYELSPGEGAFYGPKLEFVLQDCIGREWQCGTLQLDFLMPVRLDAFYTDSDGVKKNPVMIHRAIIGTFERFIGILIEHYGGKFPLWLAPEQVVIATISNKFDDYAGMIYVKLSHQNFRVDVDLSAEKIGYKLRKHSAAKTPYIIIIGEKEVEENAISVRTLGSNDTKSMKIEEFLTILQEKINKKALNY